MTVRLTERDLRVLVKCALCRWLTTDQIKRLYFPEATLNAVQKRLRKLADAGYLRSYREHSTAESFHAVGPKGRALVAEKGMAVVMMSEAPGQADHLWGVNEIRLAVELASIPVAYLFAYWELADLGWRWPVIPDAVFSLRIPGRRTFLAEYDRGTETLNKLLGKIRRYADGLEGFPFEAVLIVTEESRRFDLLAREIRQEGLEVTVLVSALEAIRATGIFDASFMELPERFTRKLLQGGDVEEEEN
jgi:Replication-relaxation